MPDPIRATLLSTLGLLLIRRFEHGGGPADLTAALNAATASVAAYPSQHPALAGAALNLGSAHRAAFKHYRDDADLTEAIRSWRAGATAAWSPVVLRLACARQWGELAAAERSWNLATEGYGHAITLLSLVSWRGLRRADQEYGLARQAPVASDAAAASLAIGDPAGAVRQLEHGRAVLWTQELDTRGSVEPLRASQPTLAASLDRVRHALDDVASAQREAGFQR